MQAWSLAVVWVLLLQLPKLYGQYRVCLLTMLRILVAIASTKTSSWCLQAQAYASGAARESSLTSTLLVQLLLATNTVHIPLLAVRLPLPILLQLLLTAAQPLLLLWAGITRGERTQELPAPSKAQLVGAVGASTSTVGVCLRVAATVTACWLS